MQKTEILNINSDEEMAAEALKAVDEYISGQDLDKKKALHLRLIAEETVGMVKAMTREYEARFWIEKEGEEYRLKLQIETVMDKGKKESLLSVSKSKKNEYAKGFMGKISDIIEDGLLSFDESMKLQQEYGSPMPYYDFIGMGIMGEMPTAGVPMMWSLSNYRDSLEGAQESDEVQEAADELEKSIVASLAKDVIVGIRRDTVDLTIVLDK
ncbi:hypothetical protein BXO88_07700 [Oribacterium sp. C9]|uniref:hypothetical protein n=1 Tax=Oribacterium sp. C9 TaxID=1943579 RepID=UPI00098F2BD9|nr:hypothetical protein [Oribacterium sp. C9]OON86395.1 hypothetical protein BXO88_07700 [Oribacterium sp. C9]